MVDRISKARDGFVGQTGRRGGCFKETERASNAYIASSRHTTLFQEKNFMIVTVFFVVKSIIVLRLLQERVIS